VIVGSHSEFPMTIRSELRQEEHTDGGQISGIRSEHGVRPSLDPGEPARSLKCKEKRAYKIPKAGFPKFMIRSRPLDRGKLTTIDLLREPQQPSSRRCDKAWREVGWKTHVRRRRRW
jgi:hypothetical protein